jgi:hypothetical protein
MKRMQLWEIPVSIRSVSIRIDRNLYIDKDGFEATINNFLTSEGFLSRIFIENNRDVSVHLCEYEGYTCEDGIHYILTKYRYDYKLIPED